MPLFCLVHAHMFEKQQAASRLEHASDLAQAALWIMHGTEDERCFNTIELRIGKRERLDWGARKSDGHSSIPLASLCSDEHRQVRLDRLHALHAGGIIKGEI